MSIDATTAGRRVLLIEEEPLVRLLIEDMLLELGYVLVAESGDLREAIALAKDAEFDVAILDVLVNGHLIFPVADVLLERNLPFIFATGLLSDDVPDRHRDRPILKKPFRFETLQQTLAAVLASSPRATIDLG